MIAQRSSKAKFNDEGFDAVIFDIGTIVRFINFKQGVYLTGTHHIVIPADGIASIYVTSTVTTSASDAGNKHVITALRNGQAETTLAAASNVAELAAYKRIFLGQRAVGSQDVISLALTTTGSPTACTLNDLVLSIDLNQS